MLQIELEVRSTYSQFNEPKFNIELSIYKRIIDE